MYLICHISLNLTLVGCIHNFACHDGHSHYWKDATLFNVFSNINGHKHVLLYCALLHCIDTAFFLQIGDFWQSCLEQAYRLHFQQYFLTLCLCHILVIFIRFQTFSLLFYLSCCNLKIKLS